MVANNCEQAKNISGNSYTETEDDPIFDLRECF